MGRRRDGSAFLAQVWLSGYATGSGHRTAAVAFDVSEQVRHRAEAGLQQLLVGTRTAVGAFWHEVRVVIGPAFEQIGATIWWDIPPDGPFVRADRHGLLQIFLKLAQNARRTLAGSPRRALAIQASCRNGRVFVRFRNSGRGIAQPVRLFRPLQEGADANGLGLYISRALARSFGGDLKYELEEL